MYTAMKNLKAVIAHWKSIYAYFTSKQMQPVGFGEQF